MANLKPESPQRTQRAQSRVLEIFAFFATSAVRLLCKLSGSSSTGYALKTFILFLSVKRYKEPQINADERRFVELVSAINRFLLCLLKFIASNLRMENDCRAAIRLHAARALATGAAMGASVKMCGSTVPMQAGFCGECGGKLYG